MSEIQQGPGWWQASDGRWYPPQPPSQRPPPQPQPPPAQYPAQYPAPQQSQQTAPKATGALIAAIGSFVVCPGITAIVSLVLARQASRDIRESGGRLGGAGLVRASRVISILNLVIVVPIGILLGALATALFLAAGERAQDRTARSDLRTALSAAMVLYTDERRFGTAEELEAVEPSLDFVEGQEPKPGVVAVQSTEDTIVLATSLHDGTCLYILHDAATGETGYAEDPGCGPPAEQTFGDSWD